MKEPEKLEGNLGVDSGNDRLYRRLMKRLARKQLRKKVTEENEEKLPKKYHFHGWQW